MKKKSKKKSKPVPTPNQSGPLPQLEKLKAPSSSSGKGKKGNDNGTKGKEKYYMVEKEVEAEGGRDIKKGKGKRKGKEKEKVSFAVSGEIGALKIEEGISPVSSISTESAQSQVENLHKSSGKLQETKNESNEFSVSSDINADINGGLEEEAGEDKDMEKAALEKVELIPLLEAKADKSMADAVNSNEASQTEEETETVTLKTEVPQPQQPVVRRGSKCSCCGLLDVLKSFRRDNSGEG